MSYENAMLTYVLEAKSQIEEVIGRFINLAYELLHVKQKTRIGEQTGRFGRKPFGFVRVNNDFS